MANSFSTESQYQAWLREQSSMKQASVAMERERRAQLLGAPGAVILGAPGAVIHVGGGNGAAPAKQLPASAPTNKKVLLLCQS